MGNKVASVIRVVEIGRDNEEAINSRQQPVVNMSADSTFAFPRPITPRDVIVVGLEINENATEFSIDLLSASQDIAYRFEGVIDTGNVTLLKVINGERMDEYRHDNVFDRSELNNDGNKTKIRLFLRNGELITYFLGSQLEHEFPLSHSLDDIKNIQVSCDDGKLWNKEGEDYPFLAPQPLDITAPTASTAAAVQE